MVSSHVSSYTSLPFWGHHACKRTDLQTIDDLYFVLSVVDYYMHTNDTDSLSRWGPLAITKFATSIAFWSKPVHQAFCGSDSRIGADFENSPPSEAEKTRYYKMLSIQAALEFGASVVACGKACPPSLRLSADRLVTEFKAYFERERLVIAQGFNGSMATYGMHSATGAVLTGLTSPQEEQAIYDALLTNPVHICSFSPFNTAFVLDAVSRLRLDNGSRKPAMQAVSCVIQPSGCVLVAARHISLLFCSRLCQW